MAYSPPVQGTSHPLAAHDTAYRCPGNRARLGSRRGEVAALSVDDINWHTGELVVTGQGSRREWLPVDGGEAIAVHCRAVAATGAAAPCS